MSVVGVRDTILAGVAWTYLWAFSSLYYQARGLYGDSGILPIRNRLSCGVEVFSKCTTLRINCRPWKGSRQVRADWRCAQWHVHSAAFPWLDSSEVL